MPRGGRWRQGEKQTHWVERIRKYKHPILESRSAGRHARGAILEGGNVIADTARCCHCGCHFIVNTSDLSFCLSCDDTVCTKPDCNARCYPLEKRLEDWERGSG